MSDDWQYVTSREELVEALIGLDADGVIGVDTESDSFFHYREKVCLIQLTGARRDVVVDPIAVGDLSPLAPVMADLGVVKVFHGADYDISTLKRDFGFVIAPIFDTMIASQALGYEKISLADLVERFFSVKLDKRYQRKDWSARPLAEEQLDYARLDSHFLPQLLDLLLEEVMSAGRHKQVREECELLEQREWTNHGFSPDDFMRIRGVGKLDDDARRVLRSLYTARDRLAAKVDRPYFKVIGNEVLLRIARHAPSTHSELVELLGKRHHVVRRHAEIVVKAVRTGCADRQRLPRSRPDVRSGRRPSGVVEKRTYAALREWRNLISRERGVAAGVLVNNAILQEIAVQQPSSMADLGRIEGLRNWQREEFGEAILDLVAGRKR